MLHDYNYTVTVNNIIITFVHSCTILPCIISNIIYFVHIQNTAQHNLQNNQDDTPRLITGNDNRYVAICCHCMMTCASYTKYSNGENKKR